MVEQCQLARHCITQAGEGEDEDGISPVRSQWPHSGDNSSLTLAS
eukprot:CAMPEP_0194761866 /NCGR_PEP_ID=MMETSP0323_2-20130528/14488_1 /TAXON_ID=2866 ORGANISM="Crypthecodinium cohnii, Strain Seligo" /NCGR_SAMPLE_ID=MMETSP0323_2 /ASSEMBLY_ACC=CAM_ASM_000346 /LENGTH=44 /DNA_ID= /DNA_START= /DNA_END= /DNA_ORIENTATION=